MNIKPLAGTFVSVSLLLELCALSQETANQIPEQNTLVEVGTNSYLRANGRYWKQLQRQSKINLLYGYEEGLTLLARETATKATPEVAKKTQQVADSLIISGFRFSDLVQQVDELYADSANVRIPVIDAYIYSLQKIRGTAKQKLEDAIVELRRKYNN